MKLRSAAHLFVPVLLVLSACKSQEASKPPAPPSSGTSTAASERAEIANEFTASAEVVAVASEARRMTLKRADGTMIEVQVGPNVRNFEQVKAGDELRVHYKEVLVAQKLPAGSSLLPAQAELAAARAKEGQKPAGGVGAAVRVRVKIESVDVKHDILVYSLPSGELMARRLATQQGRDFARKLAIGDVVQLEYAEAVALGVDAQ